MTPQIVLNILWSHWQLSVSRTQLSPFRHQMLQLPKIDHHWRVLHVRQGHNMEGCMGRNRTFTSRRLWLLCVFLLALPWRIKEIFFFELFVATWLYQTGQVILFVWLLREIGFHKSVRQHWTQFLPKGTAAAFERIGRNLKERAAARPTVTSWLGFFFFTRDM